ncbi:MAG: glycosyltransferase family 2 protein [Bacilli bacterium]|nr:glycosyltransferase family 2 protein [Bacilli bacterium]
MISFIILHYKNLKDTIECIDSIKKINYNKDKISIIVVDNGTLDNEGKEQLSNYTNDLIALEENVGFAKANNIGCKYAINKYNPDFLCVINNDTIIKQSNFIKIINEAYEKYEFDILGPKIICPAGSGSVNPYKPLKNRQEVIDKLNYQKRLLKIYQNKLLRLILNIYLNIKKKIKKVNIPVNGDKEEINCALHGCAIIFSKKYYKKYQDVFYNETFLYHEEDFLYHRIVKDELKSLYLPKLEIEHKEGASLDLTFNGDKYSKLIFRTKEIIISLEKLLELYNNGGEK